MWQVRLMTNSGNDFDGEIKLQNWHLYINDALTMTGMEAQTLLKLKLKWHSYS